MLGAFIFIGGFLLALAITTAVPTLIPPGNMIHGILNIPQEEYLVLGIPGWVLINALTNGFFWGFVIWLVFDVFNIYKRETRKEEEKK